MSDDEIMKFRISGEQKEEIKEQAATIGIAVSELFRWKMFNPSPSDTAALYEIKTEVKGMQRRLEKDSRLLTDTLGKLGHSPDNDELIRQLSRIEEDYHQVKDMADEITKSWSDLFDETKTSNLLALKEIHDEDGERSSDDSQESLPENEEDQDDGRTHYDPAWEETWGSDF